MNGFPVVSSHPRSERRPARTRALAASAALLMLSVPAFASEATAAKKPDKLHLKQQQVHRAATTAQADLDESSLALRTAASRLAAARATLVAAQRRLAASQQALAAAAALDAQMEARLQAAEAQLAQAHDALAQARQAVQDQRAAIGELAASNYANGDPALMGLSVILESQDPASVTSQLNTVDSLMSRQTTLLARLREARAAITTRTHEVATATAAVAVQRKAAAANLVTKQGLEQQAAAAQRAYAAQVVANRAAELQAAQAHAADQRQLDAMHRQEQRIKQLIIERAARQRGGYRGSAGGFLMRPVPGVITSPYGWRINPIYHYWGLHDGTDFAAPCGMPEVASSAGTVIAEQWSDVYGHQLYLDLGQVNGKNMTVVYNHLSAYRTSTGQHVSRGQTVGLAGTTGWSTGCHLHFTVLVNGTPVNPMNYI